MRGGHYGADFACSWHSGSGWIESVGKLTEDIGNKASTM
jgi:hypothetical protein